MSTASDREELQRINAEQAEEWGESPTDRTFDHEAMLSDTTWLINTLEEYIFMRERA